MTLPDERYNAVLRTRRFLLNLCNPQHTPRIPKLIRDEARSCLRHFPDTYEMQVAAEQAPGVFSEKMEDLHRMVLKYEQDKDNDQ
jgi:hypothetical protein